MRFGSGLWLGSPSDELEDGLESLAGLLADK